MQQGRKSSGGQGLPDRAAEEQATTREKNMVRKGFQGRIFLRDCFRFSPGTAYIVRGFERASRAEILYVHCLRFLSGLPNGIAATTGAPLSPAGTVKTGCTGMLSMFLDASLAASSAAFLAFFSAFSC